MQQELNKLYIIPSVFNQEVVRRIREAVIQAAIQTGVARRIPLGVSSGKDNLTEADVNEGTRQEGMVWVVWKQKPL